MKYSVMNCGGPDVPMSTLQMVDENGDYGEPQIVVNNTHLVENRAKASTLHLQNSHKINDTKIRICKQTCI